MGSKNFLQAGRARAMINQSTENTNEIYSTNSASREVMVSSRRICDEATQALSNCRAMMADVDSYFSQHRVTMQLTPARER